MTTLTSRQNSLIAEALKNSDDVDDAICYIVDSSDLFEDFDLDELESMIEAFISKHGW